MGENYDKTYCDEIVDEFTQSPKYNEKFNHLRPSRFGLTLVPGTPAASTTRRDCGDEGFVDKNEIFHQVDEEDGGD